jgi:hypothetical protein
LILRKPHVNQGESPLESEIRRSGLFSLVVAVLLLCAPAAAAAQGNPPWPARCPLKLGLLIDQSDSMDSRFGEVREATRNVIDALRDKPSEVTIIGFGTTARTIRSGVDVSDADRRRSLKDDVDELSTGDATGGATNWDAALAAAHPLDLDVVVLISDGLPTAYGDPAVDTPEQPLTVAVATADRLKSSGTRIVAVGIDLQAGADQNLEAITGPTAGQDYFTSDTRGLLRMLYGIVASSCGVPLAALPTPEPGVFPWLEAVLGALAVSAVIALAAIVRHRRRRASAAPPPPQRAASSPAPAAAIDHGGVANRLREKPSPPAPRSMSLDFLQDPKPPTTKENP